MLKNARDSVPASLTAVALAAVILSLPGAAFAAAPADTSALSFNTQIAPILQKNCLTCHSASSKMGGLVMENYDSLMKGGAHGPAIAPGKAEESRLVQMLEGKVQPRMPFGGEPLPDSDIATFKTWIDAGAHGPAAGEASAALAPPPIPEIKPQVPVMSPVLSLRFSPDNKTLAVGGYQEVRLIDPASGSTLGTLPGEADFVRSVAISPDGKMLAAGGGPCQRSGEIKIWGLQSHDLIKTMQGHKDCVYSVAWSPDGKLIASGSYDKTIKLWDAGSGKEIRTLQDHIDAVFAVAFSPDGKRLASGSQDRGVKIWDVASGRRLFTLSDASDGITGIAYSPSGHEIAAAGYDKTIYIWELGDEDGHLAQSLIADEDSILALLWSPDGKTIITSSSDGSIRFRDAATLNPVGVIDRQPDWVEALGISSDGKLLAAGRYNGSLSLYDPRTFKAVAGPLLPFQESSKGQQASNEMKEPVTRDK